jgi:hypothetical protein
MYQDTWRQMPEERESMREGYKKLPTVILILYVLGYKLATAFSHN